MFEPELKSSHRTSSRLFTAQGGQAPFFQPKLAVSSPGDAYEQEADRVANQVMRMKEGDAPVVQRMSLDAIPQLQRQHMEGKKEEEEAIQRREHGADAGKAQTAPPAVHQVLSSGSGRPLDGSTRQFMESRFGQDFGQVRIHTGSQAAESAAAIQARAYTSGNQIVFGQGEYQPESSAGRKLLAHELAHVEQQHQAGFGSIQKQDRREERSERRVERESESDRRRRRPAGGSDRERRRGGDLDSDWAGRAILYRYLTGGGDWYIANNPQWNQYMMASQILRAQLQPVVRRLAITGSSAVQSPFGISERMHGELENGEGIIGYQYLHGTNATVGDFQIQGAGAVTQNASGGKSIRMILLYTWHDIIDPNPQYSTDNIKSLFAEIITLGQAEAYSIHISWMAEANITIDSAGVVTSTSGYPFN